MALNVYIRKRNRKRQLLALAFLLPALALIAFALYAPFIWNGILSFQKWNGFSDSTWIGLDNYSRALTDNTSQLSILHSLYLGLVSTAGAVILGIFLAALVFKVYRKGGSFLQVDHVYACNVACRCNRASVYIHIQFRNGYAE